MKSDSISLGVLGGADIARRMVLPAMLELPELFSIVGVASRSAATALRFAEEFGVGGIVGYDELLEHPALQAVYIPLPNGLHAEWVERALDRGLHVLVEKPLTCSGADTARLVAKARERKLALMETFQFRFHRQFAMVRDFLKDEKLGHLHLIRSSFGFRLDPDSGNVRYDKALGGGALFDVGVYPIKAATLLLGEALHVESAALKMDPAHGVDTSGALSLLAPQSGVPVQAAFGLDHSFQCSLEIWGSRGHLLAERFYTAGPEYAPAIQLQTPEGQKVIRVEAENDFIGMLQHFHGLITSGRELEEEYQQITLQARTLEAVFAQARTL